MRRVLRALIALSLFVGSTLAQGVVRAEPETTHAVYFVAGGTAEERARASADAEAFLERAGVLPRPLGATAPEAEPLFAHDLAPLFQAEKDLVEARARASRFAEAEALMLLTRAEETLKAALALPLAHALLAEVYVQTAIVAAALRETGLVDTALRKAATLDPSRSLKAAEAPPEVLARARAIERIRDGAPRARVRVTSDPAGAEVWLDGVLLGATPLELNAAPGSHALVVRHPSTKSYASLIEIGAGIRHPMHVVLAPTESAEAQASLLAAADDVARARELAPAVAKGRPLWLFALHAKEGAARVFFCEEGACEKRAHLAPRPTQTQPTDERALERAPVWKRWPFWLGVSIAVAAGGALSAWALADKPTREERVLTLDPGVLPD